MKCLVLATGALLFALGSICARLEGPTAAAQAAPVKYEYRILQDRELHAEASSERKEVLQEKLNKLGAQGWELVNPSATYVLDEGFVVSSGAPPALVDFPDRRVVLILRRVQR